MRRNKELCVPGEYSDWNLRVSTPQGLGARPTQSSSSGSAGRMASPNLSEIISTRDHSVDDIFVNGASTLCSLFKEQEFISHQINSSLTELCVQLKADSQVDEVTPKRPMFGRGRGRSTSGTGSQMPGTHHRVATVGRGKALNKSPVGKPGRTKCFKCGEVGHHKDMCGKCEKCYEFGHMKSECPYWPKAPVVCWKCHMVGHFHNQCTKVSNATTQTVLSTNQQRWRRP